jgi:hypothetical protein
MYRDPRKSAAAWRADSIRKSFMPLIIAPSPRDSMVTSAYPQLLTAFVHHV